MSNLPDNVTEADVGGPELNEREYTVPVIIHGTLRVSATDEDDAIERATDTTTFIGTNLEVEEIERDDAFGVEEQ